MSGNNWLASKRSEVAADRILDAAAELFAQKPAAAVGMHEIASAAGCSRATLYRYFENREALHTAFVNRESYRLHGQMLARLEGVVDPAERLTTGFLAALQLVRTSPALRSWFAASDAPIGAEIAEHSDVIKAMGAAFVESLSPDEPEAVERKARWLVRVLTSLLLLPGHDDADERAMVEEFLVPILTTTSVRR
ncbi:MAG TPA: helix-turn-helix domain-containing protein [Mycobacterium sp.]|nr:helix-turn-helix domain-containing protein [Mycobacterium sp.]